MRVRIWDAPTRLFHWTIVALVALQWWTAEEEEIDLHVTLGLVTLGLLVFRLIWGLVGSSTARFASFVKGPRAIFDYLRGRAGHVLGHNPLGALSVICLLGGLAVQVGLGLFASDEDGLFGGPFAHLIDPDLSEEIAELHEDLFDVLLVLIGLHVAAILYYALVKRDNLVGPMITGRRDVPEGVEGMRAVPAWRLVVAALLAVALAWWVGSFG